MNQYKPSKVRETLTKLKVTVPVGKEIYKFLSERATHVTPSTRPELHSDLDHPLAGGTFQSDGCRTTLGHSSYAIGTTVLIATELLRPTPARASVLNAAATSLLDTTRKTQEPEA